jgi:hypothetical protein
MTNEMPARFKKTAMPMPPKPLPTIATSIARTVWGSDPSLPPPGTKAFPAASNYGLQPASDVGLVCETDADAIQ